MAAAVADAMSADTKKLLRPSLVLGGLTLLVHLLFNAWYGMNRDELYFIVCGQRLAWGYVDQPPLVPMLAALSYALAGDWLIGFRLIPALALSGTVVMTAEFVRAAGGGRYAQWLAGLCAALAPQFLAIGMLFTTDTFQPISWLACVWVLVRLEQTRDERWWLAFGAVVGLSLLSKYMIAFYVVALAIGLLATSLRASLLRPWVYAGAALGLVIVLPNILWQQAHGWPFIELAKAGASGKNIELSPWGFFTQQLLLMGPLAGPVWLAGLWAGTRKPAFAVFRAVPIAYVLLFAFFVINHGKAYYLTPIYPVLLAMGAIAIERRMANAHVRGAAVAAIAVSGAVGDSGHVARGVHPLFSGSGHDAIRDCGGTSEAVQAAAVPCRHAWLARDGCQDCPGLLVIAAKGTRQSRVCRRQLWGGGRHRHLRLAAGAAARHQRTQ